MGFNLQPPRRALSRRLWVERRWESPGLKSLLRGVPPNVPAGTHPRPYLYRVLEEDTQRAQVLLLADRGKTDEEIQYALSTSPTMIYRTRQ